ncbi:putative NTP pyrophosphohydrolase MazG-like protein [Rhizobium phage RHph_X2_24]|nr:putative NTP pyrophosphohydrolase MazG-like protein [Rhizobium phage RHph_X2_24]
MTQQPINRIERSDVEQFRASIHPYDTLNHYQTIATKSAIYPGKGTPFGLMYAALGLAEAGEVQNKVKKAFRDDGAIDFTEEDGNPNCHLVLTKPIAPYRRAQIIKELGGVLWYIAAVCDEINATMSEVALQNLDELCGRGERNTLRGDGDNR